MGKSLLRVRNQGGGGKIKKGISVARGMLETTLSKGSGKKGEEKGFEE